MVLKGTYLTSPDGLAHNDDFGQLSAWYVLNAIGFNQVAPGENLWHIGSPIFDEISIPLDPEYHSCSIDKTFTIKTDNNSADNLYVQSATLNGQSLERPWIRHEELIAGGVLELKMGPARSKWGSDPSVRPPSLSRGEFPPAIR